MNKIKLDKLKREFDEVYNNDSQVSAKRYQRVFDFIQQAIKEAVEEVEEQLEEEKTWSPAKREIIAYVERKRVVKMIHSLECMSPDCSDGCEYNRALDDILDKLKEE